jgi:hypothetical protein
MRSVTSIATDRRCTMRVESGRSTVPIAIQQSAASTVPSRNRFSHAYISEAGRTSRMNAL